jgi:hypothetical protein
MSATYEPIATITADGTSLSATFSSIPSTYTDLVIVCSIAAGNTGDAYLRFNGDTTSLYSDTVIRSSGSVASSVRDSNVPGIDIGAVSNITGSESGTVIVNVMNYSSTAINKTCTIRFAEATNWSTAIIGTWRSTAAINSVLFSSRGGNWGTGSTFTLYGIKAE